MVDYICELNDKVADFLSQFSPPTKEILIKELHYRLREFADRFDALARATTIIACGSRALGCHHPTSDLDVVVLSPIPLIKKLQSKDLDFLTYIDHPTKTSFNSPELINHASKYGTWIRGVEDRTKYTSEIGRKYIREKVGVVMGLAAKSYTFRDSPTMSDFHIEKTFLHLQALDWIRQGRVYPAKIVLKWEAIQTNFDFISRVGLLLGDPVVPLLESLVEKQGGTSFRDNVERTFQENWGKEVQELVSPPS